MPDQKLSVRTTGGAVHSRRSQAAEPGSPPAEMGEAANAPMESSPPFLSRHQIASPTPLCSTIFKESAPSSSPDCDSKSRGLQKTLALACNLFVGRKSTLLQAQCGRQTQMSIGFRRCDKNENTALVKML